MRFNVTSTYSAGSVGVHNCFILLLFHITIVSYYCYLFLRLLEVRGRYYELLTHCIPPDIIFKVTKREREIRGNERLTAEF